MATREDELNELAIDVSAAIAKARQLNLPTSAYILSMVLVEVLEALKAAEDNTEDGAARDRGRGRAARRPRYRYPISSGQNPSAGSAGLPAARGWSARGWQCRRPHRPSTRGCAARRDSAPPVRAMPRLPSVPQAPSACAP